MTFSVDKQGPRKEQLAQFSPKPEFSTAYQPTYLSPCVSAWLPIRLFFSLLPACLPYLFCLAYRSSTQPTFLSVCLPSCLTTSQLSFQVIWLLVRQPTCLLSAYLACCQPASLLVCLPVSRPTCLYAYLLTCINTCRSVRPLPSCQPAHFLHAFLYIDKV